MRISLSVLATLCLALGVSVACRPPSAEERARALRAASGTSEGSDEPEAYSLLGKPLYAPIPSPGTRAFLEANLTEARARFAENPDDPENIIWLGRRLAYLGRYREAIDVYSEGVAKHPDSYKLYRHRGHRYVTVRELDKAVTDLERATELIEGVPDEVEPDGVPNSSGVPRSTSHTNIWYHLGLAYYLKGDMAGAARAFENCMKFSTNDDMIVATSDWLYMAYRRAGREADAEKVLEPIREEMEILENGSYHKRLLMYKGLLTPEDLLDTENADDITIATQGYGVGNWYFDNGDEARAKQIFERVIGGKAWSAFGYIAAEADLKRMGSEAP